MLARYLAGIISHLAASSNCSYKALILSFGTDITPLDKSKSKPSQLMWVVGVQVHLAVCSIKPAVVFVRHVLTS